MEGRISLKEAIELTEHVLDSVQEAIEPLEALHKAVERAERFLVPWVDPNYKHLVAKQLEYMRHEQNQAAAVLHHLQCKREAVFARHKAKRQAPSNTVAIQLDTGSDGNGQAAAPPAIEPAISETRERNARGKKARKAAAAQT